MKENRKLLKEVLKDIRHDMTDEEVLNLLADSKISVDPSKEKSTIGQSRRHYCEICGQLGVYIFFYGRAYFVDGR